MICSVCGISYDQFRTGLTYRDVYELFCTGSDDPVDWRYKRRHTVLGKWREIKQQMWREHVENCGATIVTKDIDSVFERIEGY